MTLYQLLADRALADDPSHNPVTTHKETNMSNFDDVGRFHTKMGLPTTSRSRVSGELSDETTDFRVKFMQEELDEYKEAAMDGDRAGMFDALIDLVYVALGTAHMHGFPWPEGWEAVQYTNMQKVRATSADESKRGSSLDVVKPEGWTPPNIAEVLELHDWLAIRNSQLSDERDTPRAHPLP